MWPWASCVARGQAMWPWVSCVAVGRLYTASELYATGELCGSGELCGGGQAMRRWASYAAVGWGVWVQLVRQLMHRTPGIVDLSDA